MAEKFKPVFSIPRFLLALGAELEPEPGVNEMKFGELTIRRSGMHPPPTCRETSDFAAILISGCPVIDGMINAYKVLEKLISSENIDKDFIKNLNGEFLLLHFNKQNGKLILINDRFTSIPLYYHHDKAAKVFYATPYFSSLWDLLEKTNKLQINSEAFFEFLWFQRLFGNKTYDKNSYFLPDSSILEFDGQTTKIERYWQRNYEKSNLSLMDHAHKMAEFVKRSVKNKTSDNKRYGHFLSGGMDSRSVLAAFDDNLPVCFTATVGENRELRTAREIAHTKKTQHIALELDEEHYAKIREASVRTVGGMYNYDHGLFYGYNDVVTDKVDVSFHGHGFDYMFQGMYIPGKNLVINGRTLYLRTLYEPPEDLTGYFIDNASYRIKNADVWAFVDEKRKNELKEFQRESINEILNQGKELTENRFDLWEYLTFHYISRHYSFPNHASIATFVEQRTVSFDNELFDLYLSLPVKHRFNGKIEKRCLEILDERLAKIWSANTNLPVTASCWKQTAYQIAGFIKRRIFPESQNPEEWAERTWPTRDYALRNQKALKEVVKSLCDSGTLEQLGFLNMDKLRKDFPRWIDGENIEGISGDLVQTILTMGTFLEQE